MKKYSIPLLLTLLSLTGLAVSNVKVFKPVEVHGLSLAAKPTTTIDLNDLAEQDIRSYYANLNGLSESERQGNNLLKNLKPILKNNQTCFSYGASATTEVWQCYEILDRDWTLSPAKDIAGYDEKTNTITGYVYGKSASNPGSNPYIHALYVNRDAENKTQAWGDHTQTNYGINQEHIWPKSAGFDDDSNPTGARGDLMHLWAGNGKVNGTHHNNYYYGYVNTSKNYIDAGNDYPYLKGNLRGTSKTLGGDTLVFEPQDKDKGDIARVIFYMAARYNYFSGSDPDGISSANPNLKLVNDLTSFEKNGYTSTTEKAGSMGILQDLLEWNRLDPPDYFEIHRNNLAYRNYTNNRNPFVDFPDWAEYIWGKSENGHYNNAPTGVANPQSDVIPAPSDGTIRPKQKTGLDTKTIIIIAVAAAVVIIVAVIIFICLSKKSKKKVIKAAKKTVKKTVKKSTKKKK